MILFTDPYSWGRGPYTGQNHVFIDNLNSANSGMRQEEAQTQRAVDDCNAAGVTVYSFQLAQIHFASIREALPSRDSRSRRVDR